MCCCEAGSTSMLPLLSFAVVAVVTVEHLSDEHSELLLLLPLSPSTPASTAHTYALARAICVVSAPPRRHQHRHRGGDRRRRRRWQLLLRRGLLENRLPHRGQPRRGHPMPDSGVNLIATPAKKASTDRISIVSLSTFET